jgi:hypothetical protein
LGLGRATAFTSSGAPYSVNSAALMVLLVDITLSFFYDWYTKNAH